MNNWSRIKSNTGDRRLLISTGWRKKAGKWKKGKGGKTGIICIQGQGWDKGPESYKPSTRNPIMLYHREELGQGLNVDTNLLPTPTPLHPSRLQLHPFKKSEDLPLLVGCRFVIASIWLKHHAPMRRREDDSTHLSWLTWALRLTLLKLALAMHALLRP